MLIMMAFIVTGIALFLTPVVLSFHSTLKAIDFFNRQFADVEECFN